MTIATPYRSWPAEPTNKLFRVFRRCKWVLGDPATWRDLLWTLVNVPVSVVLGLLPAFLLVAGAWTVVEDYGILLDGWTGPAPHGFLLQVFFLSMLPACVIAGPWLLKMHAIAASSLLAPTRSAGLPSRLSLSWSGPAVTMRRRPALSAARAPR